jgi:hypothetical protein
MFAEENTDICGGVNENAASSECRWLQTVNWTASLSPTPTAAATTIVESDTQRVYWTEVPPILVIWLSFFTPKFVPKSVILSTLAVALAGLML